MRLFKENIRACLHTNMNICYPVYIYGCMCKCIRTHTYTHTHIYIIYIYIYMYIYLNTLAKELTAATPVIQSSFNSLSVKM